MKRDRRVGTTWLVLATALALAGCTASGAGGSTAVPVGTPGSAKADVATGIFTGYAYCNNADPEPGADPELNYATCYVTAGDPRLSGTSDASTRMFSGENVPDAAFFGGAPMISGAASSTLSNDAGSWLCTEFMIGSGENATGFRDSVCIGKGDYIGLTAYMHAISNDARSWGFVGWIKRS